MTAAAAENKPSSDSAKNNNKKRKQRYLPHNKPAKKGSYPLRPGVEGFFITCDGGREKQATHEAMNLFDTFYEELHGGGSGPKCETVVPTKRLNKITKFSDSDSSSDESCSDEEDAQAVAPSVDKEGENKATDVGECVPPMEQRQETDNEKKSVEIESTPGNKQHVGSDHEKHAEESKEIFADTEISQSNTKDQKDETEGAALKKQRLNSGTSKCQNADEEKDEEVPIDKQLEAELVELGDRKKRRFISLDSGCNGVIFIQMNRKAGEPGPVEIVQRIMQSASATRKHMSRFILRVLPVEATCYASEEEVSKAIKPFIARYFPTEAGATHKFAVLFDARANTGIERMKFINVVAKSVPPPHKVDLSSPDKTIIVQVAKTICMVGVVEKYKELSKFNLRQLTSPKP